MRTGRMTLYLFSIVFIYICLMCLVCVLQTKTLGRLPVVNFAAGGVATPADAALMMQMGMDGVFVGSGIFKSGDPAARARAIVQARFRPFLVTLV